MREGIALNPNKDRSVTVKIGEGMVILLGATFLCVVSRLLIQLGATWIDVNFLWLNLIWLPIALVLIVIGLFQPIIAVLRRRPILRDLGVVIIIGLTVVGSYKFARYLPTRSGVLFRQNREQFVALAEEAHQHIGDDDGHWRLPDNPVYGYADANRSLFTSGALVVHFVIWDHYVPLVYVSSDRPEDVYNTCISDGYVLERLETNWYVCMRDWN